MLEFETLNDAIIHAVTILGGSKVVGAKLWPAVEPETAQRKLLDALNVNRSEKLDPSQVLFIARAARAKGDLTILNHMLADCNCAPAQLVEPEAELAGLLREFNANSERQAAQQAKIERLLTRTLKAKVA